VICVAQVGRGVAGAHIHVPLVFGRTAKAAPPFPSDPHYDAKAWGYVSGLGRPGSALLWNVAPLPRP
jgi:hypothetical protein